ncbi:MAG: RluA family pseudouridine synthase [Sandaracinaceae bacterium]
MKPLEILFQDESLIAINKPAGMLVHPGAEKEGPEWIAMKRVRDHLGQRVFPVHRLDRPTSGVLLFALDKKTSSLTQRQFADRQVSKEYLAVVCGETAARWTCTRPLRKNPEDTPREAETRFERLCVAPAGSFPEDETLSLTLMKAVPRTGRFHQIRRHLLENGTPIVGDFRYAGRERSHALGALLGTGTRMLLQARRLELRHPHTEERLRIEAPVEELFRSCFPDIGVLG